MNVEDAAIKANAFVLEKTGVNARPASVEMRERGGLKHWIVVYDPEPFFPEDVARGSTVDGPYVLKVDDTTGVVTVVG